MSCGISLLIFLFLFLVRRLGTDGGECWGKADKGNNAAPHLHSNRHHPIPQVTQVLMETGDSCQRPLCFTSVDYL